MVQLLITNCSDTRRWYSSNIGEKFPLLKEYDDEYLTLQPPAEELIRGYRFKNYILKQDAEIIDV